MTKKYKHTPTEEAQEWIIKYHDSKPMQFSIETYLHIYSITLALLLIIALGIEEYNFILGAILLALIGFCMPIAVKYLSKIVRRKNKDS